MPTESEPETNMAQRPDPYLEAVVDDHVAVEERPLALNYSTWKQ